MRIALISYEYPPETGFGGIGTYTHYHARALSRLGHEVHVFAGTQQPERRTYRDGHVTVTRLRKVGLVERLLPKLDRLGLYWFKNRVQNAANSFSALRRELEKGGFDVVEMPECGGEGALLNHCLDLPTIVRLHSPAELIMSSYPSKPADRVLTAMVERLGMTGAKALSSCSAWLAQEVRRRGLTDRPITVIPNGIDLAVFDQDEGIDIHERFGVPRDALKIFFANRLEQRKGIHVVRDLLVPVLEKHPQVVFVLAGADPDGVVEKELRPMLAARGLQDRLFHLGRIPLREVRACLKQCDIFLLPSIWENAPYSLLEAMSAGKAIVASDCGGVPEMLRHEIDGLIAHTGDASAFARAIDRLQSSGLRARLGQSARARVEARFTDELVARRSLEFYRWALGAPLGEPHTALVRPDVELEPGTWFQAWWIRGVDGGEPPRLGAGFAELGLDELAFVHAVSSRVYWSQRGRGDSDAVTYLEQLATLHRERALAAQGDPNAPLVSGRLGLPALSHPLFGDDSGAEALLGELWRLGQHDLVADWLVRETAAPEFGERATRRLALRRLAVDAFRRRPDEHTAAVLRGIYRAVGTSSRVVQQDQEFIRSHPKGAEFAAVIADFGLHAPLRRPAVFGSVKRRRPQGAGGPAVTVLIPSYRHEQYIAKAIESVLAQTHENLRVLVVDDCSPDGTVAAARAVDDARVEVRSNAANLGLGGSILAALPSIDTPYVALLNSDDVFHPERLEKCLAVLEADPEAALVTSRIAVMDDKERRLSPETSCVLDQGPAAHGWVRWYERVTAELAGDDWTALPALLRHNHLATSSNLVCRTSFLRAQAGTIAPLKYCLDWSLFLHACIAGALRCVPEALVGYRLHGANTVWFDDGARPGYLHEVNAVVADALRAHVARRGAAGAAAETVAEEVAGLLQTHVAAHGETDGMALLLADLLAGHGSVPAAFRSPELVAMAQRALAARRPAGDAEVQRKARLDRHAVEALSRRVRELEPMVGRLREDLDALRAQGEDVASFRLRLDAEHAFSEAARSELAAVVARSAATERELTTQRDALERSLAETRRELAETAQRLADRHAELGSVRRELAAQQEEALALAAQLQRSHTDTRLLEQTLAGLEEQLGQVVVEREGVRRELRELRRQSERERARLESSERLVAQRDAELDDAHRQLRRASEWASQQRIEQRRDQDRLEQGLEYRVGRLLTRKLHLGGLLKTALRWATLLRIGAQRLGNGLRKSLPGRKPSRVVFVCDAAFPAADTGRLADELLAVTAAGFDTRVLCTAAGGPHWLGAGSWPAMDRRVVLSLDAALLRRDRRFFTRRNADAVAAIDAFPMHPAGLAPIFTFARSARSLAAGSLHAVGLGPAALNVWGAGRLLGVQFTLRLETDDLPRLRYPGWGDLACAANALLVDSEAMGERVRSALGVHTPSLLVIPPLVPGGRRSGAPAQGAPFILVGPFADVQGLLSLAAAVRSAVERGADPRFVVLGAEIETVANFTAIDWFRGRLAELGLLERFEFRRHADPAFVASCLNQAAALVEVRTGEGAEVAGPTRGVVAALAAGVAVVGFRDALAGVVRDGVEARLVAGGDSAALGAALAELASDPHGRARLGAAGRRAYDTRFAPTLGGAELFARIRALHNARLR